jgi:hypothetical protein
MPNLIEIEGFPELLRALARTGPDVNRTLRERARELAEPIAHDAERLARTNISGLARQRRRHWEMMRVGVTRGFRLVYVAPRQRGVSGRGPDPRRRPKFANLLRDQALAPAVDANAERVVATAEHFVDDVTREWWK